MYLYENENHSVVPVLCSQTHIVDVFSSLIESINYDTDVRVKMHAIAAK